MAIAKGFSIDASELNGLADVFQTNFISDVSLKGQEENIAAVVKEANRLQYETRGERAGTLWKPLADGSDREPLNLTGKLKTALLNPIVKVSADGFQADIHYEGEHAGLANIHDEGAEISGTNKKGEPYTFFIPPRPTSRLIDEDVAKLSGNAFDNFVAGFGKRLAGRKLKRK